MRVIVFISSLKVSLNSVVIHLSFGSFGLRCSKLIIVILNFKYILMILWISSVSVLYLPVHLQSYLFMFLCSLFRLILLKVYQYWFFMMNQYIINVFVSILLISPQIPFISFYMLFFVSFVLIFWR